MSPPAAAWQSVCVLGQDDWTVEVLLQQHESEAVAKKFASRDIGRARLGMQAGRPVITLQIKGANAARNFGEDRLRIFQLTPEARARLGRPVIARPAQEDAPPTPAAQFARDPFYTLQPGDMEPSARPLSWLVEQYGEGYPLDNLGWAVRPVDAAHS